jgi:type I restriction enzyme S subunit
MDGALVGKSYAVISNADLPCLLLQRVARVRSNSVDSRLLAFWVGSDSFVKHVDSLKTHSAIPHISPADIRGFAIAVPSDPEEQRAITTVLSDMDADIVALEQRRNKTRALKQGMMQELLTGRTRLV